MEEEGVVHPELKGIKPDVKKEHKLELVHDSPMGVDDIGDRIKVDAKYSTYQEDEHFPGWYEQH